MNASDDEDNFEQSMTESPTSRPVIAPNPFLAGIGSALPSLTGRVTRSQKRAIQPLGTEISRISPTVESATSDVNQPVGTSVAKSGDKRWITFWGNPKFTFGFWGSIYVQWSSENHDFIRQQCVANTASGIRASHHLYGNFYSVSGQSIWRFLNIFGTSIGIHRCHICSVNVFHIFTEILKLGQGKHR